MRIDLLAAGKRMPTWVSAGFDEYAKRMPHECRVQLVEIPIAKRTKNADVARLLAQEGKQMLAKIPATYRVIALDVKGRQWDTVTLARHFGQWQADGQTVSLLIGGPDGLDPACLARADDVWSLSPLTMPHPLVRIVVMEQLYRAWSIRSNHPYHRG